MIRDIKQDLLECHDSTFDLKLNMLSFLFSSVCINKRDQPIVTV